MSRRRGTMQSTRLKELKAQHEDTSRRVPGLGLHPQPQQKSQGRELYTLLPEEYTGITRQNRQKILYEAICVGDVRGVKHFLELGMDVTSSTLTEESPLLAAIKTKNVTMVQVLLKYGARVNAATDQGFTPLHVAAEKNVVSVVTLLLDHGAEIDALTVSNESPLHVAVFMNSAEAAKILIARGADLSADSLLLIAAKWGHLEVFKVLTQCPEFRKIVPEAIETAIENSNCNILTWYLESGGNPNLTTKRLRSLLHIAVLSKFIHVADQLLNAGAFINALDVNGLTPLHLAIERDQVNMCIFLVERGANYASILPGAPCAVMVYAIVMDTVECFKYLLDCETTYDSEKRDRYENRLIHYAALFKRKNHLKILLEKGEDVNVVNNTGRTPLHLTAMFGHFEISQILLEAGANVDACKYVKTPSKP